MAENIKDLIQKIQEEGVRAAENKAREIEEKAKKEASVLVEKARAESEKLLAQAREKISQAEAGSQAALKQSARDLLLSLRKEINLLLDRLILSEVREALSPSELARIIAELIKGYKGEIKGDIVVSLSRGDLERIEKHFLDKLKEETKKGILLKPAEEISGGLIISYDQGKSHFDFTDRAISEYIGTYVKPKLQDLFKGVV